MKRTPRNVAYCAPPIRGICATGTIFADGQLPAAVQALAARISEVKKLIVPIEKYADTMRALKDPASRESYIYRRIQAKIRGGVQ